MSWIIVKSTYLGQHILCNCSITSTYTNSVSERTSINDAQRTALFSSPGWTELCLVHEVECSLVHNFYSWACSVAIHSNFKYMHSYYCKTTSIKRHPTGVKSQTQCVLNIYMPKNVLKMLWTLNENTVGGKDRKDAINLCLFSLSCHAWWQSQSRRK